MSETSHASPSDLCNIHTSNTWTTDPSIYGFRTGRKKKKTQNKWTYFLKREQEYKCSVFQNLFGCVTRSTHFITDRHGPQKGSINLRKVWQISHYYQSILEKENMLQQYRVFPLNLDLLYASFYFKPMLPKTSKDWWGWRGPNYNQCKWRWLF